MTVFLILLEEDKRNMIPRKFSVTDDSWIPVLSSFNCFLPRQYGVVYQKSITNGAALTSQSTLHFLFFIFGSWEESIEMGLFMSDKRERERYRLNYFNHFCRCENYNSTLVTAELYCATVPRNCFSIIALFTYEGALRWRNRIDCELRSLRVLILYCLI